MGDLVVVGGEGPVATIAFNRPARQNALTPGMLGDLAAALGAFSSRDDVRVVVVRGAGASPFSSGYDLGEVPPSPVSPEDARAIHAPVRRAAEAILACRHPVVAAVRGVAFGAALELALHCDLRIASEEARFRMPPVQLGLVYTFEGVRRFVEVLGLAEATALFLLGGSVAAGRAREIGLVHRVVPAEAFEQEVAALAATLADNAPLAARENKALLTRAAREASPTAEVLDRTYERIAACLNSADAAEARRALAERRRPVFRGG